MHLRLLQEISAASGNTIVLGLPGVTPLPLPSGEPPDLAAPQIEPVDE
jgi:hypothetical protein